MSIVLNPLDAGIVCSSTTSTTRRWLSQGDYLRKKQKYTEAVQAYDALLAVEPNHLLALLGKAICCEMVNQNDLGRTLYQQVLSIDVHNIMAMYGLGNVCNNLKDLQGALDMYKCALRQPHINNDTLNMVCQSMSATLALLGLKLISENNKPMAMARFWEALAFNRGLVEAWFQLGVIAAEKPETWPDAVIYYQRVLELCPNHVPALCNLGVTLRAMGQLENAIALYEKAAQLNPNVDVVNNNLSVSYCDLATVYKMQQKYDHAMELYHHALLYNVKNPDAWYNMGVLANDLHHSENAVIYYQMALQFNPDASEAWNNLGVLMKDARNNLSKAIECYEHAIAKRPNFSQSLNNLAVIYTLLGQTDKAHEYSDRTTAADPNYSEAFNNVGVLYRDEGLIEESLKSYERCLELNPKSRNGGQNKLLALNYFPDRTLEYVGQEHLKWGNEFVKQYEQYTTWLCDHKKGEPIRIGYVSSDFFVHSVSYFIEAVFRHCDPKRIFNVAYSNVGQPDPKTEVLRSLVSLWRDITPLSAKEAAELIRTDKIDILFDLGGNTAGNRVELFAMRCAPIQISWIGYPNTSGLPTMQYHIVDAITDPLDSKQLYSETLLRMPHCFLCYTPPTEKFVNPATLKIDPNPPSTYTSYITFISCGHLAKTTTQVIDAWVKILQRVPTSHLIMKTKPFACEMTRKRFQKRFADHGIALERVEFLSLKPNTNDHLNVYHEADIALDTFVYTGTTTTCESLLMGVPMITICGDRHCHNVSTSILSNIPGTDMFRTRSIEEYIETAVKIATSPELLKTIRKDLQSRFLHSDVCNGPKFAQEFAEMMESLVPQTSVKICVDSYPMCISTSSYYPE